MPVYQDIENKALIDDDKGRGTERGMYQNLDNLQNDWDTICSISFEIG